MPKKKKVKKTKIKFKNGSEVSFNHPTVETDLLEDGELDGAIIIPRDEIFGEFE